MNSRWRYAISDWSRLYGQILFFVVSFILVIYVLFGTNLVTSLVNIFQPFSGQLTDSYLALFLALSSPIIFYVKVIILGVCLYYLIKKIRNANKTYVLNGNSESRRLHLHYYAEYWIAYHLLGVRTCRLTLVPIPMQFKIILQGPFTTYLYKDGIQDADLDNKVSVEIISEGESNSDNREMNIVLSDTYPIILKEQCSKALARRTLCISRFHGNRTRIHDRKFVETVLNEVRMLPPSVTVLHIYATLNPWNTYEIVKEVFKTGGRDSIERLHVYYQSSKGNRLFTTNERIYLK